MLDWLRRSLWDVVPRDQQDSVGGLRRRQIVTLAFVLAGAATLAYTLRIEPGSRVFYLSTLLLPLVWVVGAFSSGRLHLGHRLTASTEVMRPIVAPVLLGLMLAGIFVLGGLVVRQIDPLEAYVSSVLEYANQGSVPLLLLITMINGIAEELFFRGAAYAAIPSHPVAWTTLLYVVATLATGNVMLAFAAILVGTVCGLQRRASGGVLAPILTHITWSAAMLLLLPLVFR